jgi:PAS domain S-box-containing protein
MTAPAGRSSPEERRERLHRLLDEDPADLYENAPCGYLSALPDGTVVKVNRTLSAWTGRPAGELLGARLQDLLAVGGRVFYETHLGPLLRLQGAVREIALDLLRADGSPLPCLVNALLVRDDEGSAALVRVTLFEATARRRYERELLEARRAAEESEARARTLHQVVSDLAAATSVADVATVIVQRGREALRAAAAALALVVDPSASGRPVLDLVRAVGMTDELLCQLGEVARGDLEGELAQGVRSVTAGERLAALHPDLAREMTTAGLAELVVVPVSADSRRLGVLVLGLGAAADDGLISLAEPGEPRSLTVGDVDLMWTLGRQAGQALERARLHEQTGRQAERSAFLLDAARLLAAAGDVEETVARMAELAVPRLADLCVIDLVTEHGLERRAARHADPGRQPLLDELRQLPLDRRGAPHPSLQALREARTRWLPEVDEALVAAIAQDERYAEIVRALDVRSVVSVPFVADGRVLGVVTLCGDRGRSPFGPADVEVAEQLALQVALVVDKAQRYELDVLTSHTLQSSLLPAAPPRVPGLTIAVRYLPATRGVEVGGDFYDVVPLPDGTVAVTVGDVVGHDVTAAATMGQLTSVHRALLADRPTPGAVVDRLQASWALLGLQRMATALFATLEPAGGRLRVASAGHLPPLRLRVGGVDFLPVLPSRMLGAPPSPAVEWVGVLAPGETLLLFTDGLVESRTADLDAGLSRLLAVACEAGTTEPEALCDRVLAGLAGSHRADDIALLALSRTG